MTDLKSKARHLLEAWKEPGYVFGPGCSDRLGGLVRQAGSRAAVVVSGLNAPWADEIHQVLREQLAGAKVAQAGEMIPGPRPNSPIEDIRRLRDELARRDWDVLVAVGGGSLIDASKAALAWGTLQGRAELEDLLGTGLVTRKLQESGRKLPPLVAVQLASGSGAHLTRYANCTDLAGAQKMLIVDDALVPDRALFDYAWTRTMPAWFTMDAALDGVAHCWEVMMGASGKALENVQEICLTGIELIVANLERAIQAGDDLEAREALGLGTDLGGYAIMLGGTNGAHLNSFSLVDILPHGRACALMNPYWTVLFASAIGPQLRALGRMYHRLGYMEQDPAKLEGRSLGLAVAEGMLNLSKQFGFPTSLEQVEGFEPGHIDKALRAGRNPKLRMKLRNMPIPMEPGQVDEWMGSVLQAARKGDPERVLAPSRDQQGSQGASRVEVTGG